MEKITRDKWIWMPHPAHYICARDCKFFLATKIGDYIISTIGEYWPDSQIRKIHAEIHDPKWWEENKHEKGDSFDYKYAKHFGFDDIGAGRKYETMVFKAIPSSEKGPTHCKACPFQIESGDNCDGDGYNDPKEAFEGHYKLCEKYSML